MLENEIIELLRKHPGLTSYEIKENINCSDEIKSVLKLLVSQNKITKVRFKNEELYYIIGKTEEEKTQILKRKETERKTEQIKQEENLRKNKESNILMFIIFVCLAAFIQFTEVGFFMFATLVLAYIGYLFLKFVFGGD